MILDFVWQRMGCCEKTHGLVGHLVFALKVEGKGMVCELLWVHHGFGRNGARD